MAGVLGWLAFRLPGGPALRGPLRWGLWLGGIGLAVALGAALQRGIGRRALRTDAWIELGAVGWAVAIAAGWFLDVQVGGPFMGAVTAAALTGAATRDARVEWRVLAVLALALVGAAAGAQATGARGTVVGLLGALGGTIACLAGGALLLGMGRLRWQWVALPVLWGLAWYGAWWITSRIPAERGGMLVVLSLEVALAIAVASLATALLYGRALVPSLLDAVVAALVAVVVSAIASVLLDGLLPRSLIAGSGRDTWLDVGNVAALFFAAAIVTGPLVPSGEAPAGTR